MIELYNNGYNHSYIAKSLNRSTNSVAQKFNRIKNNAKWKSLIQKMIFVPETLK